MSASDPATPARIRNTALGEALYADLVSEDVESFGENVETCADDPCGTTEAFVGSAIDNDNSGGGDGGGLSCVDGDLGVYCPCFVATVTGVKVGEEVDGGAKGVGGWGVPNIWLYVLGRRELTRWLLWGKYCV